MKRLSVLFDWDAVVRNPYSGFYTFGTGLINEFSNLNLPVDMTLFFQKRYKRQTDTFFQKLSRQQQARLNLKSTCIKFRWLESIWEILAIPSLESIAGHYQMYHCFHHFMPRKFKGVKILTVHDLRRYKLPHLYPRSRLRPFERAVKRANHFICVSEATKKDLCSTFDINKGRVDVVHLATNINVMTEDARNAKLYVRRELKKRGIPQLPYLLAFSSKDRRKNISVIARAFDLARKATGQDIMLLIIGSINLIDKKEISKIDNVFWLGEVEEVYPWLYQSQTLVFTSLYEGFGLPILEAFTAKVPVITSNCSSMPEVAGEAALLVDPRNIRDISEGIKTVCMDKNLRNELVAKGEKRAKEFSWEKSARQTFEIYQKVFNGSSAV